MIDDNLVSVFKTEDPGLLPLAQMALESAGIEYLTRSFGKVDNLQWTLSQKPTNAAAVMEIVVAGDVAAQARDLLADLDQSTAVSTSDPALLTDSAESQAIRLEVVNTGVAVATLSEEQLQNARQPSGRKRPAGIRRRCRGDPAAASFRSGRAPGRHPRAGARQPRRDHDSMERGIASKGARARAGSAWDRNVIPS